jgi:hypothetical protein
MKLGTDADEAAQHGLARLAARRPHYGLRHCGQAHLMGLGPRR